MEGDNNANTEDNKAEIKTGTGQTFKTTEYTNESNGPHLLAEIRRGNPSKSSKYIMKGKADIVCTLNSCANVELHAATAIKTSRFNY